MNPIRPVDSRESLPKKIEQIIHWIDLIGLEHVILRDSPDGTYNILLPIKNCPDIHIALESNFTHISFFSNGLTTLGLETDKVVCDFLRKILRLQGNYFTSRVITTGSNDDLRIFLGYRLDEVSMYRFSRKIRELIQFVKEVALLIEEFGMNELWRKTELEPKFPAIDIRERIRFL
ncbi:MAG: hypothetical protein ACW97P_07735 [Candidatus Hodarchaeales archaeon]|jgi:hypothetical protein